MKKCTLGFVLAFFLSVAGWAEDAAYQSNQKVLEYLGIAKERLEKIAQDPEQREKTQRKVLEEFGVINKALSQAKDLEDGIQFLTLFVAKKAQEEFASALRHQYEGKNLIDLRRDFLRLSRQLNPGGNFLFPAVFTDIAYNSFCVVQSRHREGPYTYERPHCVSGSIIVLFVWTSIFDVVTWPVQFTLNATLEGVRLLTR